jgi:hypothetical protein
MGGFYRQEGNSNQKGTTMKTKCECGHEFEYTRQDVKDAHVLLCGDSTKTEDVERLMAGAKADMIFTDPPYNVNYEGYTEEALTIKSDAMTEAQYNAFMGAFFTQYKENASDNAAVYVCHASAWQRETESAMLAAGIEVRCQIVWVKNTFAWGFGRYKFRHEPIFYAHIKGKPDNWYGDKTQNTVWEEKKPSANRLHPTMKPVISRYLSFIHRVKDCNLAETPLIPVAPNPSASFIIRFIASSLASLNI